MEGSVTAPTPDAPFRARRPSPAGQEEAARNDSRVRRGAGW